MIEKMLLINYARVTVGWAWDKYIKGIIVCQITTVPPYIFQRRRDGKFKCGLPSLSSPLSL